MDNSKSCLTIILALLLVIALLFILPVFLMLGWNLGVCALFASLPYMSYWAAFWIEIFLIIVMPGKSATVKLFKDNE